MRSANSGKRADLFRPNGVKETEERDMRSWDSPPETAPNLPGLTAPWREGERGETTRVAVIEAGPLPWDWSIFCARIEFP